MSPTLCAGTHPFIQSTSISMDHGQWTMVLIFHRGRATNIARQGDDRVRSWGGGEVTENTNTNTNTKIRKNTKIQIQKGMETTGEEGEVTTGNSDRSIVGASLPSCPPSLPSCRNNFSFWILTMSMMLYIVTWKQASLCSLYMYAIPALQYFGPVFVSSDSFEVDLRNAFWEGHMSSGCTSQRWWWYLKHSKAEEWHTWK